WWFRPRVRSVGGIGPGSGDTCCTWPGEIVKISPEEDVDLVAMPGDFIGDSCNEANLSGTINEAKLKRLRYHSWVGTTFGDDDTPLDEIFLWRRAPQYADNNRDGIGNYCEDDWDYTSHGVWDADPGSGEWDRESINSNGSGGDFIAPDGHGVPDSLPAMTTPPPTCGSFQADPRDAGLNGALMLFVVLPTLFAWRSRHRS
ncbi:MAG: hypothetical protein KC466_20420, partial [Myxococcales bacterium]|nr:hypothetical protein [Myxococcales bacterium]